MYDMKKERTFYESKFQIITAGINTKNSWKAIDYIKEPKVKIAINISTNDLKNHFHPLLNIDMRALKFQYCEPFIENHYMYRPFSDSKIQAVLRSPKENKPPGDDQIPHDICKYYTNDFFEYLVQLLNEFMEGKQKRFVLGQR